jgi:hypothetical protein
VICWEDNLTEEDVKFLRSIQVEPNWRNENLRFREEHKRPRDWSDYLMVISSVGIIAVCAALLYSEYLS